MQNADFTTAIDYLKKGQVILHKTDTVWGLACDASNEKVVQRLIDIKNRSIENSFTILIHDLSQLNMYVKQVPDIAWDLVEFSEKPLTVIYDAGKNLPEQVCAADGSIAIRLVKDSYCQNLLKKFGRALLSTSANLSGTAAPAHFGAITDEIKNKVDWIEPYPSKEGPEAPSTIVKLSYDGTIKFIRK